MTTEYVPFQGRGPVRIGKYGTERLARIGNNSQLELAIAQSEINQIDFESEGGGEADSQDNITGVTAGMNILSFTAANIALGMRGLVVDAPGSQQTDEAHNCYQSDLCILNYNPDPAIAIAVAENGGTWAASTAYVADAVDPENASWLSPGNNHIYKCTVAGTSDASEPTWPTNGGTVVDGTATWQDMGDVSSIALTTDYLMTRSGFIPTTTGKIVDGMPVKVTYTPDANHKIIDSLTQSGTEWKMVFDGMNFAKSNRPCTVIMHRVKFTPTTGLGFVSENYGEMPLSAKILKDDNISGSDKSKYFQVRWQDAA